MSEQEQQQPNIYVTGDEARLLMQLLTMTPALQLYTKLNVINTVQPAQQTVETPE
jgi:hypothetical protein